MSAPAWTPGPWRINKYRSIGAGDLGTQPIVAHVEPFYGADRQYGDDATNARLIAAAPDLYEALLEFCDVYENCGQDQDSIVRRINAFDAARAALARARGEPHPAAPE